MRKPKIDGNMIVADAIEKFPEIVDVLFNHGIQCFGCGAATNETLLEGYRGHYGPDADVDTFLEELNSALHVQVCVGGKASSYDEPLMQVMFEGEEKWVCTRYLAGECDCRERFFTPQDQEA